MLYTGLSYKDKELKMSFDNIFEAYKEAILACVDKRDYNKVDILNTSMKLLSETIASKPLPKPETEQTKVFIIQEPAVTFAETEIFIYNLLSLQGRISSTDALNLFYKKYGNRFTDYDIATNTKGDPRWKTRFWNVTSKMRKENILMPNQGAFVNKYVLNPHKDRAQN